MTEHEPYDLHTDRSLITAILDIIDCKRVVTEMDGACTWREAWQLHRARVAAHTLLHRMGLR